MPNNESPVTFNCRNNTLIGIAHHSKQNAKRGVVVVVGGPQYRVGSHRQFLLLARGLAELGIPVFRFDYRGMGDSEGPTILFDSIDDDIKAAIDTFLSQIPSLEEVVIWGLCDGATAASFYGFQDDRVKGLILVNPWIRTVRGEAKVFIKHYYLKRILSKAFWVKVLSGHYNARASINSFISFLMQINKSQQKNMKDENLSLPDQFYQGIKNFQGSILFITSGKDLTAVEFLDTIKNDKGWDRVMESRNVSRVNLDDADHTFSRTAWMEEVIKKSASWTNRI